MFEVTPILTRSEGSDTLRSIREWTASDVRYATGIRLQFVIPCDALCQ